MWQVLPCLTLCVLVAATCVRADWSFKIDSNDKDKIGPLLEHAGVEGGVDAFKDNPLAGGCTATVDEFRAVYGDKQGFRNFINTQIGTFSDCLDGPKGSSNVLNPTRNARSKRGGLIRPNASKAERVAAAREQVKISNLRSQEAEIDTDVNGNGPRSNAGEFLRKHDNQDAGQRGRARGRQRSSTGQRSENNKTPVPADIIQKIKERVQSFEGLGSQADYFGIKAWEVERTQRAVAGGTFDETLFGVSLNTHRTSFAEDLETAAGAELGFEPVPFATILGRRAHRIRGTLIHGQYNQWFQSPQIWDELDNTVQYREGDIVIATHPKAGTTWTEQIVLLLLAGGDEERVSSKRRHMPAFTETYMLDPQNLYKLWFERDLGKFHQAKNITENKLKLMQAMPGEHTLGIDDSDDDSDETDNQGKGRGFKLTLDPNIKVIYVARNPKDQAVSMFHQEFHFGTLENEVQWPLDAWLRAWFEGVNVYGSWFVSLKGWFEALVNDKKGQMLFLKYEDMIHDHAGAVRKIAKHLNIDASESLIQDVVEKSSMEHIKDELSSKGSQGVIYRKGGIGDWRNVFSPKLSAEFDKKWKREMKLRGLCGKNREELQFDIGDGDILKC